MAGPLSNDLRERIIAAWQSRQYGSWEQIADTFRVGRATVDRLIRRFRMTGSVDPAPHGGGRAHGRVPRNRGFVLTMLGALSLDGVRAMMTNEGGTNRPVFLQFLREHLVPKLQRGDVVVMDNLGAHHATGVREVLEAVGAT